MRFLRGVSAILILESLHSYECKAIISNQYNYYLSVNGMAQRAMHGNAFSRMISSSPSLCTSGVFVRNQMYPPDFVILQGQVSFQTSTHLCASVCELGTKSM